MATSRDVQEIIAKLSSDKAKPREDGIKLLNSWMQGERAYSFCRLLGRNTARMKPDEIPHDETWPFLVTLLMKCISMEIAASKKKPPKLIFAKTLRCAVQCAEDVKLSGKDLLLLSIAKLLFSHIWDVIRDAPSFQSEYSSILRHIVIVKEYCYQIRRRVYCSLVVWYVNKVEASVDMKVKGQLVSKEEVFRCIITFHILLENPPGDVPDDIRDDLVKGFVRIFSNIRDDGKVSRKLMDCLNSYLLRDGPNLGPQVTEINSILEEFLFRSWLTTHDRGLKNSFITYARIILKLFRSTSEQRCLVEKLLDIIIKELDQGNNAVTGYLWNDAFRDDKAGMLGCFQQGLMDLAATVFYLACKSNTIPAHREKRMKLEHAGSRIRDGLMQGSTFWNSSFSFLIHYYGRRLEKSLIIYWFEGTIESLKRIFSNPDAYQSPDALLWLLRSLEEFSALFRLDLLETSSKSLVLTSDEVLLVKSGWQDVWRCLMHGLPTFSSFAQIVDVGLRLLGHLILREEVVGVVVPQDMWDLRIFKHMPSMSALYFVSCYFSRIGIQADARDGLYLRKDLLRSILELVNIKEPMFLNDQMIVLIPAAIFSLCTGCGSFLSFCQDVSKSSGPIDDCSKFSLMEESELEHINKVLECSTEAIAEIQPEITTKVEFPNYAGNCLPRQIREPLMHEFEEYFISFIASNKQFDELATPVLIHACSLLCNCVHGSILTRPREEKSFSTKVLGYVVNIVNHVVLVIDGKCREVESGNSSSIGSILDSSGSTLVAFRSFLCSPLFTLGSDFGNSQFLSEFMEAMERLLVALGKLFVVFSSNSSNLDSEVGPQQLPAVDRSPPESVLLKEPNLRIVDMELDADESLKETDAPAAIGTNNSVNPSTPLQWKLELTSIISMFSSALPDRSWEILSNLITKENENKVCERILLSLCKSVPGSAGNLSFLVDLISKLVGKYRASKLCTFYLLNCVHALLETLQSKQYKDMTSEENLDFLLNLINIVADIELLNWSSRNMLVQCLCFFIALEPCSAQALIERLLVMLHDPDYRVRLLLARKIGLLFQTWDGHSELFNDICLNFGFKLVRSSKENIVKAGEVLFAGSQSALIIEGAVITLAHVAASSDRVELEAVFMICAVAAMDPCQRELIFMLFDNLSQRLHYNSRTKYLEQLMGSILAHWVNCEVSLVALVEVQDLFLLKADSKCFLQYCCMWLLPPLILRGEVKKLSWVAKVCCQPLFELVREYFVPIFAVCMAVHCSSQPDKETGAEALTKSILHYANITELERDDLIKKHMVSIVGRLLSLTSSSLEPELNLFSKETVLRSVQTVVDGFLEKDDTSSTHIGVIDKINIFRPDRVFKFLLETHGQITAAIHPRHRCHRLSAIEVLISILGPRSAISSTSLYIINIVGQCIQNPSLQEQCCAIISKLLGAFKSSPDKDAFNVLGEQLQLLVSKLVSCCLPSEPGEEKKEFLPSVTSLLNELIVDSDPSLHGRIKELEPLPQLDCLERLRMIHDELCKDFSPRDRFLKFAQRAYYLPKGLLLWSLRNHHKQLLRGEIIWREPNAVSDSSVQNRWNVDANVVFAVWMLVDLCDSDEKNAMGGLLADFVSRIGIADPCQVVFHLPKESCSLYSFQPSYISYRENFCFSSDISSELLVCLLKLLEKFLSDDSVKIVDVSSLTLKGILSTEKGHGALLSLGSYERSLLGVHAKGVSLKVVDNLLLELQDHTMEQISLEDSSLWSTENKTYEKWVCTLVWSLISQTDDVTLRLCQKIVLLKYEIAELLFPNVLVNLAKKVDPNNALCNVISAKVQENIFVESNCSVKSIQVILESLNKLRSLYVTEKASSSSSSTKHGRHSYSGRSRNTTEKSADLSSTSSFLCSSWGKVYWLSIDYLVVAKAAIWCGSYFTAVMYIEHWCEEHFNGIQLGPPDFSHLELLPAHIELLVAAFTQINEPDSIYGIIQSNKLSSQITMFEHEGNWNKALEYYDLVLRSASTEKIDVLSGTNSIARVPKSSGPEDAMNEWKSYKGLMRSLQKIGCAHVLDMYCQGLTGQRAYLQHDVEFMDLQYEAAWRAGNWDFSLAAHVANTSHFTYSRRTCQFNENLHSCLRALYEGNNSEFHLKLADSKEDLVLSASNSSKESTKFLHSAIVKLQILDHLTMAWDVRWKPYQQKTAGLIVNVMDISPEPAVPDRSELEWLNVEWSFILKQAQLHLNLFEPFIAFRHVLLKTLNCRECTIMHLLDSASTFRKASRFSLAASALHELKQLSGLVQQAPSETYFLARLEEAKLLRAQDQNDMATNIARYILQNCPMEDMLSNVYRLVGKWLAETRSSNSSVILEKYLKHSVELAKSNMSTDKECISRQCHACYQLAHYCDGLFTSYEERLVSNEWQAAMRLRKHKKKELDALIKRLKSSSKGEKTDYSVKIQELQKQLTMDKEEAEKLEDDRDNFLSLALEGYQRSLVLGSNYDLKVVFRLVSLWFSFYSRRNVVKTMSSAVKEVQSYKFIPLVYQIASRLGSLKEGQGSTSFQLAVVSLVRKMAIDHPYHTIFLLLALANGDRVKDKQRSRNSFVVDMDKKLAAENLLNDLSSYHGSLLQQMKQLVEVYIKLAEMETKKEETNKKVPLPREIRSLRQLELVPVVTANFPVDPSCQYKEGSFPYFKGLGDSVMIMNGINAPKVVECYGSDGKRYRQLAKSGNDDLRQDAVMEQFFGLVNNFLQNHRDSGKRRLKIRTYKVIPFTPSAGVLEWVDGTVPLGEYLLGSTRNGGAHGRYGIGDWTFLQCREHMMNEKDKRKAFMNVYDNFRPVMHYFFLERFLQPSKWFESRLCYTRSVAASSMVGYIVGLGDRHSMNILIDQETAEVVHIDLGVAFEQGLMLKTPERVPFRLTRDIIDGMGVTGVEGVFRRCCEETLTVMRANKEALLTIIEVFIHDPLYKWALSPLKALQRQKETDDDTEASLESSQDVYEGNKDAARATLRVKQKLDGYEMGEMRSVQGQVQQLIQDAIDIDRLCHMFPGWGAWL